MKKKRIIPLVLHRHGHVVQTREFKGFRPLGLLDGTLDRFEDWRADEVVLVDISESPNYSGRVDLSTKFESDFISSLRRHSTRARMPITVGGQITSLSQAEILFRSGADKILINTSLQTNPSLIGDIADKFGSQAVVAGIDWRWRNGEPIVYHTRGAVASQVSFAELVSVTSDLGVGEIFLNSIERDGMKSGLDLKILEHLPGVQPPVTICGGAGNPSDFVDALKFDSVDGVAAANFFQHVESSIPLVRSYALSQGLPVRSVS